MGGRCEQCQLTVQRVSVGDAVSVGCPDFPIFMQKFGIAWTSKGRGDNHTTEKNKVARVSSILRGAVTS